MAEIQTGKINMANKPKTPAQHLGIRYIDDSEDTSKLCVIWEFYESENTICQLAGKAPRLVPTWYAWPLIESDQVFDNHLYAKKYGKTMDIDDIKKLGRLSDSELKAYRKLFAETKSIQDLRFIKQIAERENIEIVCVSDIDDYC